MTLRIREVSEEVPTVAPAPFPARIFHHRGPRPVPHPPINSFGKLPSHPLQRRSHLQTMAGIGTVFLRQLKEIPMQIMRYLQLCSCLTGTQGVR